jgi:hypothetical protein
MWRKKVSMRCVTHNAQNTQHHVEAMRDWVKYVLGQMKMLNIPFVLWKVKPTETQKIEKELVELVCTVGV